MKTARFGTPTAPSRPGGALLRFHAPQMPLRVGTRTSALARAQTRHVLDSLRIAFPALREPDAFEEHPIRTSGDAVQDRSLADLGGKALFAKEIHEALAGRRIDLAVHSLKDLETKLPDGIVLASTLKREDARDVLILGPDCRRIDLGDPFATLPTGALIGTASVRRQAQLLHARPDLRIALLRGNVPTRLARVQAGRFAASILALAGLRRLELEPAASLVLAPDVMVPAAGQGIVGVTVRAESTELRHLLAAIEDPEAHAVSAAERALLAALDGSCRTPIGGYARLVEAGAGQPPRLQLTGLVARKDGSFLLKRSLQGAPADAAALGAELGASLRVDSPRDIFDP